MNVLDILLLVAAVWFAVVGYRQGFVVGILSVIGFLGGGLVAVYVLPVIWDALTDDARGRARPPPSSRWSSSSSAPPSARPSPPTWATSCAGYITWSPARALDATGGALVNVVAMLLVAWLIGSALAGTTLPTLGKEVRSSKVLLGVSRVLPDQADTWFADFSSVLAQNGFPQVFSPFSNEPITDGPAARPEAGATAPSPPAPSAPSSRSWAPPTSCGKVLEGTGFVFADRRVMTNAHVVGGVDEPTVQIGGEGRKYDAKVVLYDWQRDIAVLDVPDLKAPALRFTDRRTRAAATARSSRASRRTARTTCAPRACAAASTANGPDIYHRGTVRRDVYSLYATVRQGNSGGPLLTPDGKVYGVVFAKSLDDADTGYALTADEIREDIAKGRTANQQVDSDSCAL